MLNALTLLLVCQLIGEAAVEAFALPVPGPVIGMALLFGGLCVHGWHRSRRAKAEPTTDAGKSHSEELVPRHLATVSRGLLEHLSLLFVPAGVGVVLHLQLISDERLPITAALIGSTIITIAVTALVMRVLDRSPRSSSNQEG